MTNPRPTLSVCILARSLAGGLERLLDEIDGVADEIVIGVDADSIDDTLAVASRRADVAFRFEHVGPPVRARRLILEHAHSDWILSLDEDEGLDAAFEPLLAELLSQSHYSHFWFPRKWIVDRQPLTYVHSAPWFPDWQLRLFRNDLRRVWHPGIVHSGYRVMGMGCHEDRTAILHYEALILRPEEREAKIDYYRQHGSEGRSERVYRSMEHREKRDVNPGPAPASRLRPAPRGGRVVSGIVAVPPAPATPPWCASLEVRMPAEAIAGSTVLVEATARNTGALVWEPVSAWPRLFLASHITKEGAEKAWEGERYPLPRVVEPGESAHFLMEFHVPREPGAYLIEWDFVSEWECWFAACGSQTKKINFEVLALSFHP